MDILKYFYEEPASLEVLTPDLDPDARRRAEPATSPEAWLAGPRYYRGYLAGTNLASGRVGLTALAHPEAFVAPLLHWLAATHWARIVDDGQESLGPDTVSDLLQHPTDTTALTWTPPRLSNKQPALIIPQGWMQKGQRHALPALLRMLDEARVVFFPEPAHHGYDWSFFSAHPMREALTDALRQYPHHQVRRFVLPYQQARSEHKFYFESHDLEGYARFELT